MEDLIDDIYQQFISDNDFYYHPILKNDFRCTSIFHNGGEITLKLSDGVTTIQIDQKINNDISLLIIKINNNIVYYFDSTKHFTNNVITPIGRELIKLIAAIKDCLK